MATDGSNNGEVSDDLVSNARSYQIEALEQAIKHNTIVYLETGCGKTLIAIMLLQHYAHLLKKPSPFIAVFLAPTCVLVKQQADAVREHTDLEVEEYCGDQGKDFWKADSWKKGRDQNQVMIMTPAILETTLRHNFLSLDIIKLLIFDECHHAKGRHPYAVIMEEFYHRQLQNGVSQLPRILGMTASPVLAKGPNSSEGYWKHIKSLETVLHSKIYTCASESVLAEYIPFPTTKYKFYKNMEIPLQVFREIKTKLSLIRHEHELSIRNSNLSESSMESTIKRLLRLSSDFEFCLDELGISLALKTIEAYCCEANDVFTCGQLDVRGKIIAREFCKDANKLLTSYIPAERMIYHIDEASASLGLLSSKVVCLIKSLVEYRHVNDLRCIIFVERVITAIALKRLLGELNPNLFGWKTEYIAGHYSTTQSQSRCAQNKIVQDFRKGEVNIIVATSILEEGLDVQSCNLVIRFDLSATVCSFIQSRGRARMKNSDFLLLIRSGDNETLEKVNNYLSSGQIMREESLNHASEARNSEVLNEVFYHVESTGATLSLGSRLPSDGYFKPLPRFMVDKELGTCIINFPPSCPLPSVQVSGTKLLKQHACLEACKQLHKVGASTDNLVPDTMEIAVDEKEIEGDYVEEQVQYVPPELVGLLATDLPKLYHFYSIKLNNKFDYELILQDIILGVNSKLELDNEVLSFDLESNKGWTAVSITYIGTSILTSQQINLSKQFQMTILRVLVDRSITKLAQSIKESCTVKKDISGFDYILLPANKNPSAIDWNSVCSVMFLFREQHNCFLTVANHQKVHTKNGIICSCLMENALVYTPHNERLYCTTNRLNELNANSFLEIKEGERITYKSYYKKRHNIKLCHKEEVFFAAKQLFVVRNLLQKDRHYKEKESSNAGRVVELPCELCYVIMSPISINTFYSFSFVPSIIHRIESFLIALNLKKMHFDNRQSNGNVPALKILEAITTKKCLERFHLESFETLGDSFLKYAASQQLFKKFQGQREGILSSRRERIISNASLCRLGCKRNIPGFIRNEPFDPATWVIPGEPSGSFKLEEKILSAETKMYIANERKLKQKVIADVVEALIGVFLSEGGEMAALSFMSWLGIEVDFVNTPYTRELTLVPERFLDIQHLESLLNYSFRDASLLVEALTHGSYMHPEVPRCYQRLEFLGDAVLDYLITVYLYNTYPGMTPGMLTELRSASVNNDCYAQSAVKVKLHNHILYESKALREHILKTVSKFDLLTLESTFGWESETTFPKVLGDVMESLAGAILVDSGYNKDIVFKSIRPLLEPLVTPQTLKIHPIKELHDICQKNHYQLKKSDERIDDATISFTIEVEDADCVIKDTRRARDKKMAEKLASKSVLEVIKQKMACSF